MPRWEPDAPGRLQQAALELYSERGYDDTTATEIAQRAGLNRRTFFRYFPDKREVFFWGSEALQEWWLAAIEVAAPGAPAFEMIRAGLDAVAARFEERRSTVVTRQRVIDATPDLQERERTKLAALVERIAEALHARGIDTRTAQLAASMAVTVEHVAFTRWVNPSNRRTMHDHVNDVFSELQRLTS